MTAFCFASTDHRDPPEICVVCGAAISRPNQPCRGKPQTAPSMPNDNLTRARFIIMFVAWLALLSASLFGSWLGGWTIEYWHVFLAGATGFIVGARFDKGWGDD